ncbi:hypothetical protein [Nonomuraea candida]|uniref:hypothetical protein n=1 Tax=Nonomuraea candida TaxID=359159 RepID=UPI0005BAA639|nr:hypothetical protein [Nonomuraea candida]
MDVTVVRGNATPEELEAVVRALTRRARARGEEPRPWSGPAGLLRGPDRGWWPPRREWRLSAWTG